MYTIRYTLSGLSKVLLLLMGLSLPTFATADTDQSLAEELKTNQAKVIDAEAAKEVAVKARDALAAQQASKPSPDTERKLKDAETDVMLADSKLNSVKKSVERVQKKLDEGSGVAKTPAPAVVGEENKKAAEEKVRKEAEAKAAAQKTSEELAKKEAEAKLVAQKASEEQVRKEAEAKVAAQKASEEAAKKAVLAAEMGIDKNCIALPSAPTKTSVELSAADMQAQAYAQGFLKQVNQLVSKKTAEDVPPVSPFPTLEGSKLNPCDPNQKQALKFGYMGNGQYRVETPVLSGEQTFSVKNVVQPLNRTIPEADNGEVYVFFLDGREGRAQLNAYKKSLLDIEQTPQQ